MIIKSILAGTFKLDGGAMFGVVPKKIWSKLKMPDANNLCTCALRCLYVEYGEKKVLIDTGMGNKQEDKFFNHYEPAGTRRIDEALIQNGVDPSGITDVILSHLHFDHCGGAFLKNNSELFIALIKPLPNKVNIEVKNEIKITHSVIKDWVAKRYGDVTILDHFRRLFGYGLCCDYGTEIKN